MRVVLFVLFCFALSCEDRSNSGGSSGVDASPPARLNLPDVSPPVDLGADATPIWDAAPDAAPDAVVDSAPPPACDRYGYREPCDIPGLLGPCSVGERICYATHWTQCSQRNFPRMEVCDDLDNDCDGQLLSLIHI